MSVLGRNTDHFVVSSPVKLPKVSNQQEFVLINFLTIMTRDVKAKNLLSSALKSSPPDSFWYKKNETDFYSFLFRWMYFIPKPGVNKNNPLNLQQLMRTKQGLEFLQDRLVAYWLTTFFDARGHFLDTENSTKNLHLFLENAEVKINDYVVPESGFKSYNELFVRRLKNNVRPIDGYRNEGVVILPVDCQIKLLEHHSNDTQTIVVKHDVLTFKQMFSGFAAIAEKFVGGPLFYLEVGPMGYHHFHAPVSGKLEEVVQYYGMYDAPATAADVTMNTSFVQKITDHRRALLLIRNARVGLVGMVTIGYWMVSSSHINVKPGDIVKKGQDLGNYAYGGSGMLLYFEPGRVKIDPKYLYGLHNITVGRQIAVSK